VGFAAYNHYQVTRNEFAQNLCITQTTIALKKLQEEIDRFSPANLDAIITASLFLAGTAQDWHVTPPFPQVCQRWAFNTCSFLNPGTSGRSLLMDIQMYAKFNPSFDTLTNENRP
jgi:hypothetical protein